MFLDTVHDICEDLFAIKIGQNITGFNRYSMEQTGIGGDDKVGIFIALECLNFFEHIKVAFFRDEESGCEGSYEADTAFFEDTNFVLQCDRQGCEDFITEIGGVKLSSRDFQSDIAHILKKYGYSFSRGLMTDVMALKELLITCSMANISCGYYSPHTDHEYVNLIDVENCLNLVKSIINEIGHIPYPHVYKKHGNYLPNYRFFEGTDYCLDCYAPNPTRTGYCELCNEYYQFMEK